MLAIQGLPRIRFTTDDVDTLARMFVDRTGCDFGGQVKYKQFMESVGAWAGDKNVDNICMSFCHFKLGVCYSPNYIL